MADIRRGAYEYVVIGIIIVLSVVLGMGLYAGRDKVRKNNLLLRELEMLRSSVSVYKLLNKRNPSSLDELAAATYSVDSMAMKYVDVLPKNVEGRFIDPFGSPYHYDPEAGWVASTTKHCENW